MPVFEYQRTQDDRWFVPTVNSPLLATITHLYHTLPFKEVTIVGTDENTTRVRVKGEFKTRCSSGEGYIWSDWEPRTRNQVDANVCALLESYTTVQIIEGPRKVTRQWEIND